MMILISKLQKNNNLYGTLNKLYRKQNMQF